MAGSTPEELEDDVTALQHAMWGVKGDNGIITDVRELKRAFYAYIDAEQKRREEHAKAEQARREEENQRQRNRDRAMVLAALSSCVGLIGVIVTLVLVLQGAPT